MPPKKSPRTKHITPRGGTSARSGISAVLPPPRIEDISGATKLTFGASAAIIDQVLANVDLHIRVKELQPLIVPSSISYAAQMNALLLVSKIRDSDARTDDTLVGELDEPVPAVADSSVVEKAKSNVPPIPVKKDTDSPKITTLTKRKSTKRMDYQVKSNSKGSSPVRTAKKDSDRKRSEKKQSANKDLECAQPLQT